MRQRCQRQGQTDPTHSSANDGDEFMEEFDHEQPPTISMKPLIAQAYTDLVPVLKGGTRCCMERGNFWDANYIQNVILHFLAEVRMTTPEA